MKQWKKKEITFTLRLYYISIRYFNHTCHANGNRIGILSKNFFHFYALFFKSSRIFSKGKKNCSITNVRKFASICTCMQLYERRKKQFPLKICAHEIVDQTDYDHWTDGG